MIGLRQFQLIGTIICLFDFAIGSTTGLHVKLPRLIEHVRGRFIVNANGRELPFAWHQAMTSLDSLMTQLRESAILSYSQLNQELPLLYSQGPLSAEARLVFEGNRERIIYQREKSMMAFKDAFECHHVLSTMSGSQELDIFKIGSPIVEMEMEDERVFESIMKKFDRPRTAKYMGQFLRFDLSMCNAGVAFTHAQKEFSEKFYAQIDWSPARKLKCAIAALANAQERCHVADEAFKKETASRAAYTACQGVSSVEPMITECLLSKSLLDMLIRATFEKPMVTANYELVGILDTLNKQDLTPRQKVSWRAVQKAVKALNDAESIEGEYVSKHALKVGQLQTPLKMAEESTEQVRLANSVFAGRKRLLREIKAFLASLDVLNK